MMDDYLALLAFVKRMGCLLWCNERKRMLVVSGKGHELVKQYYKKGGSGGGGGVGGSGRGQDDPIVID